MTSPVHPKPPSVAMWISGLGTSAAIGLSLWGWWRHGNMGFLVTALGFAAVLPMWVMRPFWFTDRSASSLNKKAPVPNWAVLLHVIGVGLLLAGCFIRWSK
jgi:hypothetical protein